MAAMTMTFDVPEKRSVDFFVLRQQVQAFINAMLLVQEKKTPVENIGGESHIFDCFDDGGWYNDPRTAHEISQELHDSHMFTRSVESW